jgi:hypothetical protein
MMSPKELSRRLTDDMRSSDDDSWVVMRSFLRDQGMSPDSVAMADRFTESDGDFGVVVTADGRAFTFIISPTRPSDSAEFEVVRWKERVNADDRFAYEPEIAGAMEVLADEADEPGRQPR